MTAPPFHPPLMKYPPITSGASVKQWQQQMKNRGWNLVPDGQYGPISKRICQNFQREHGLDVDGIVGPITWKAAWEAPSTASPPAPVVELPFAFGSVSDAVKKWERQADSRGYRIKNIDGHYDDESASAAILLQQALGLPETGEVDEETWEAAWKERVAIAV